MLTIKARHQSGYWANVDSPLFTANARRMRAGDCTIVTRTECTNQQTNKTLNRDFGGEDWGIWHPRMNGRPVDCSLEWDKAHWQAIGTGLKQLTDFRVTTKGGVRLLPSSAPWALLRSLTDDDVLLFLSAAHNNLDNTEARAQGWLDEAATFAHWQAATLTRLRRQNPSSTRILRLHQADVNKNLREDDERAQVQNRMLAGTGLHHKWPPRLPVKGTHGKQIIDYAFTSMSGATKRMAGDRFSDHDPIESVLRG